MSERKYTAEEIVKALECFSVGVGCKGCPFIYQGCFDCGNIPTEFSESVLALINRQKAEVEEWKSNANDWQNQYLKLIEEMEIYQEHIDQDIIYAKAIKAEAIKEFAERLKDSYWNMPTMYDEEDECDYVYTESFDELIDNLVAEMTEGK